MTIRSARCSDVRIRVIAAVAVLAIAGGDVCADPKAEAQVLFDQGLALFKDGKYPEACAAFEASVEKYAGLGARGKLAECYEKVDKLARAWALYREVADAARRDSDPRREQVARQRADALLARVPKITIIVPPESAREGLTITRDGQPVSTAELGLPIYVDAGKHTITASAPGMAAWTFDIQSVDGAASELKVPLLRPAVEPPVTGKGGTGAPTPAAPAVIEPGSKRAKELAQSLVTDGIGLVEKKEYQLALDRFVAAYELYPTPKLLLNMASTLREMGRLADAADMYQAFIEAPDTKPEFVGESKQILNSLDDQLYVLMVRVTPPGSDVRIDGGPWISVGDKRMMVRLQPGMHMVTARKQGFALEELSITAFEGEKNELELVMKVPVEETRPTPDGELPPGSDQLLGPDSDAPARAVDAGAGSKDGQTLYPVALKGARAERGGVQHQDTAAFLRNDNDDIVGVIAPPIELAESELGITAQLRIDGAGGGAAVAAGIAYAPASFKHLELDLTGMASKPVPPSGIEMEAKWIFGVFLGARYRILTGQIRPTLGAGVPTFLSDGTVRVGVRGSGGLELVINGHLAVVGELGFEHFFNTQPGYKANVFVPLIQLTGRL